MRNLFEDAIYLFDMELDKPTIIKSIADNNYELHIIPNYEEISDDGFHFKVIGIQLNIYIIKDNELEETDIFSGNHMNDKYFFDFLNWFHDNPNQLIEVFYRSKLEVITKT